MLNINDVIKVRKNQDYIKVGDVGTVGTVVHIFDEIPFVYLIEFIDSEGRTTEMASLKEEDMSLYWVASTETYFE
ncbi:DUF4926 domain-containing protein [Psychrobacter immobilis]|uniref:DUF4926 domain-containing protein n=1 Tax=Psychrobacter immobilis TaxID=498 RepID=UPI001919C4CA|nr:DUF4926 domain-containing protein [Psychrobacter immobilis]